MDSLACSQRGRAHRGGRMVAETRSLGALGVVHTTEVPQNSRYDPGKLTSDGLCLFFQVLFISNPRRFWIVFFFSPILPATSVSLESCFSTWLDLAGIIRSWLWAYYICRMVPHSSWSWFITSMIRVIYGWYIYTYLVYSPTYNWGGTILYAVSYANNVTIPWFKYAIPMRLLYFSKILPFWFFERLREVPR